MHNRKFLTLTLGCISSLLQFAAFGQAPITIGRVMLCGGPEVVESEVVRNASSLTLQPTWYWRPEASARLPPRMMRKFITTDDCKSVNDGKEVLITSSGSAVALVSRETGDTLFYATVSDAHSAEILPGGYIVVAASSDPGNVGDAVILFRRTESDKPVQQLPLKAAHGVVWDAPRKVLWALGETALLKIKLLSNSDGTTLVQEESIPLPSPGGHDLQMANDGTRLYVSVPAAVMTFDIETHRFETFAPLLGEKQIKSLSIQSASGQIAYTQADKNVWWTYTLRFRNPVGEITVPSFLYKVRWVNTNMSAPSRKLRQR